MKKQNIKVPALVLYEVYKKIKKTVSEEMALEAAAMLSNYEILNLTQEVAFSAADISLEHEMGMADSFMLAFAFNEKEELLTLDNDFSGKPQAKVLR